MNEHTLYMQRCLELAAIAAGEGESPVGSVVVKEGRVVGEGYEKSRQLKDVTRHAEVVAMLDALQHTDSLAGAVLYTNVEPCILCAYMVRHHRIATVVFAKHSGELGSTHAPFNILTSGHFSTWGAPPLVLHFKD